MTGTPLQPLLIANPLSWTASLRRNLRPPRGAVREQAERWLVQHGWYCDHRLGWVDPIDRAGWDLVWAIRLQATREAQIELEQRGWGLTGGDRFAGGAWRVADEVRHERRAGYCTPAAALKRERLLYPLPMARLAPRMQVLQGGRSA